MDSGISSKDTVATVMPTTLCPVSRSWRQIAPTVLLVVGRGRGGVGAKGRKKGSG